MPAPLSGEPVAAAERGFVQNHLDEQNMPDTNTKGNWEGKPSLLSKLRPECMTVGLSKERIARCNGVTDLSPYISSQGMMYHSSVSQPSGSRASPQRSRTAG